MCVHIQTHTITHTHTHTHTHTQTQTHDQVLAQRLQAAEREQSSLKQLLDTASCVESSLRDELDKADSALEKVWIPKLYLVYVHICSTYAHFCVSCDLNIVPDTL